MTPEEFVNDLKNNVKNCVAATVDCFVSPSPESGTSERFSPLLKWFQDLSEEDMMMVKLSMEYAGKEVLFNLLAVIDGVNYLPSKAEGRLELFYVTGRERVLINDPGGKFLYELFGFID